VAYHYDGSMTSLENARTYAELTAIAATLKGKALQEQLELAGLGFLRSQPVARRRESLANFYGRGLDSKAIARMAR
jgi:hypothetical protein